MNMALSEFGLDNLDQWPRGLKSVVILVACAALLCAGYWLDISSQIDELNVLREKEVQLRQTFELKQHQAANVQVYKTQLVEIHKQFSEMLRQLPNRSEIPGLLEDISKTGIANGLEFQLFAPQAEKTQDFYTELPIKIMVTGNYHQLAQFVSEVAAMDRVVTLHDLKIAQYDPKTVQITDKNKLEETLARRPLQMTITAKTYRYSDAP